MCEVVVSPLVVPVFLLTENRLLREALVRILSKKSDITVVGATAFATTVLEQLSSSMLLVVLLDSTSLAFHGPRLVSSISRILPDTKVVMIGMERDEGTFFRAVREGVMGYVLKDASALEIVSVIRAVRSGEAVCPPLLFELDLPMRRPATGDYAGTGWIFSSWSESP